MLFHNNTGRPPAKDAEFIRINPKLKTGPRCFIRSLLKSCDLDGGSPSSWVRVRHCNLRAPPTCAVAAGSERVRVRLSDHLCCLWRGGVAWWRMLICPSLALEHPSQPSKKTLDAGQTRPFV